jgi:glutathione S-transferase
MQPLQIYNAPPGSGPNPWKVIIIVKELDIPFEIEWISYTEIKQEPYISLNPNGRLPAMTDPNTSVTLFESGAIIDYLVTTYDRTCKISYGDDRLEEKWLTKSWLMFQMSGQGPMLGQKMWFTHFHAEPDIKSVIERYGVETKRIVGVIDSHLRKQRGKQDTADYGKAWLVGNKCTYADLSFVPWNLLLFSRLFPDGDFDAEGSYPEFWKWHCNVLDRSMVRKVVKMREEAMRTMEDTAKLVLPKQS